MRLKLAKPRAKRAGLRAKPASYRTPKLWPAWLAIGAAGLVAVLGAIGIYFLLTALLGLPSHSPPETAAGREQRKLLVEAFKAALGVAAGLGAVVALTVSLRRHRIEESQSRRDDQRLFTDRFESAAEQLGHAQPAVRLAGAHAMARLADDWDEQRQTCSLESDSMYLVVAFVSALLEIAERVARGEPVSPDEYPPIAPSPDGGAIDHPVEMLPVIAKMVDAGIEGAREMYAKLSQARSRPHVLDDHTVGGVERSMREELEHIGTYEWQLDRWAKRELTSEQRSEVQRLRGELAPWRAVVQMALELCAELRSGTIDAIMRKDDAELALEVLLGLKPLS